MSNCDDLSEIVKDFIKVFDENIDILSNIEYSFNSDVEDCLIPNVNKTELIDMVYEVSNSVRIKKAESSFIQRYVTENSGS